MKAWPCWHMYGEWFEYENPRWRELMSTYTEFTQDGAVKLSGPSAVRIGIVNSSTYRNQFDMLYLSALDVSTERFRFVAQFYGTTDLNFTHQGSGLPGGEKNTLTVNPLNNAAGGGAAAFGTATTIGGTGTGSNAFLQKQFASGGELMVGILNQFTWNFFGPNTNTANSLLNLSFVQPFLRFGGRMFAMERLTIVERQLLANLRALPALSPGILHRRGHWRRHGVAGPQRDGGFAGGTGLTGFSGTGTGGFGQLGQVVNFGGRSPTAGTNASVAGRRRSRFCRRQRGTGRRFRRPAPATATNPQHRSQPQCSIAAVSAARSPSRGRHHRDRPGRLAPSEHRNRAVEPAARPGRSGQHARHLQSRYARFAPQYAGRTRRQHDRAIPPGGPTRPPGPAKDRRFHRPCSANCRTSRWGPDLEKSVEVIGSLRDRLRSGSRPPTSDLDRLDRPCPNDSKSSTSHRKQLRRRSRQADESLSHLETRFAKTEAVSTRPEIGSTLDHSSKAADDLVDAGQQSVGHDAGAVAGTSPARLEGDRSDDSQSETGHRYRPGQSARLDEQPHGLVDTWRLIEFNANALKSGLTVSFDGSVNTTNKNPLNFNGDFGTLSTTVQFDAPLTRRLERNNFRQSLISYQQTRRQMIPFQDQVYQRLRAYLRTLRQFASPDGDPAPGGGDRCPPRRRHGRDVE